MSTFFLISDPLLLLLFPDLSLSTVGRGFKGFLTSLDCYLASEIEADIKHRHVLMIITDFLPMVTSLSFLHQITFR